MSRRRKAIVALAAVAVIAAGAWSLRPRGYTYQGKTVEEWFNEYCKEKFDWLALVRSRRATPSEPPGQTALAAFREMGTNALPFLTSRINRDLTQSRLEQWCNAKLPAKFRRPDRATSAMIAAGILRKQVQPPLDMARPLLASALASTNQDQRYIASLALDGRNYE